MLKQTQIALLIWLLPTISAAQTCKTTSIPASTPTSQFTNNNNGTVTDNKTGLMWKKCSEDQIWNKKTGGCDGNALSNHTRGSALIDVQKLNSSGGFAEKTDWRVPNIKELTSIIEDQCESPSINLTVFPDTPTYQFGSRYWSSSPDAFTRGNAEIVNFSDGSGSLDGKFSGNLVRLVRSVQ